MFHTSIALEQYGELAWQDLLKWEREDYIARHKVEQLIPSVPYNMLVVIPALNEAEGIQETLESLTSQTNQNFAAIIVDNGSSDGTQELVIKFAEKNMQGRLFLLKEEKRGIGYARKKAIDQAVLPAVGDIQYVAWTDADTKVPHDWVERYYQNFETTGADIVSGEIYFFDEENPSLAFFDKATASLMRHVKPTLNGANFAIKTQSYVRVDGIEQPLTKEGIPLQGEDRRLGYRMLENNGKIVHIPLSVTTNPRRYISHMLEGAPADGSLYGETGIEHMRNMPSQGIFQKLPQEVVETQVDRMLKALFKGYIYQVYTTPINREKYWDSARQLLIPREKEFTADVENNTTEDVNVFVDSLWSKYKHVFLTHLTQLVEDDSAQFTI